MLKKAVSNDSKRKVNWLTLTESRQTRNTPISGIGRKSFNSTLRNLKEARYQRKSRSQSKSEGRQLKRKPIHLLEDKNDSFDKFQEIEEQWKTVKNILSTNPKPVASSISRTPNKPKIHGKNLFRECPFEYIEDNKPTLERSGTLLQSHPNTFKRAQTPSVNQKKILKKSCPPQKTRTVNHNQKPQAQILLNTKSCSSYSTAFATPKKRGSNAISHATQKKKSNLLDFAKQLKKDLEKDSGKKNSEEANESIPNERSRSISIGLVSDLEECKTYQGGNAKLESKSPWLHQHAKIIKQTSGINHIEKNNKLICTPQSAKKATPQAKQIKNIEDLNQQIESRQPRISNAAESIKKAARNLFSKKCVDKSVHDYAKTSSTGKRKEIPKFANTIKATNNEQKGTKSKSMLSKQGNKNGLQYPDYNSNIMGLKNKHGQEPKVFERKKSAFQNYKFI
eukprot:TRINITY_DN10292_c0_g1_i1.p1 TRINITY_DN10292_c0_g1~~TRINITY_DN10292_c0_g1_i1.p1  ORF type:complete len:451 (+),score=89.36 TRINITY_DN10292_c0_g1_i1:56-1408(+)